MTIQVGDRLPGSCAAAHHYMRVQTIDTRTLFGGHEVVLFAVPGAFTPTCSERHLPGFVENFDEFHKRGIDVSACRSTTRS